MSPHHIPRTPCAHCGKTALCTRPILDELVCQTCLLRFLRAPKPCPGCAETKVLAFYDRSRRPACADCTGNEPVFACPRCGREDNHYGRYCGPCTLHERASALLADPTGNIHPRLRPVFDAWMAGKRPQSTVQWLTKPSAGPQILRAMALGELPISHETFDELPSTRPINYIRDLLAATAVIEPYQPLIARTTHWLNDILEPMPKRHADLIHRFAQWHLLRRLRRLEAQNKLTRSAAQNARASILTAVRLLIWLDEHQIALTEATQTDLDRYLARYPGRGPVLTRFLNWTNSTHLTQGLRIPAPPRPDLQVELADDQRWQHIETLLHDTTIRRYPHRRTVHAPVRPTTLTHLPHAPRTGHPAARQRHRHLRHRRHRHASPAR